MQQLILASSSPHRKKLFEQIGLTCKIVPSAIPEKLNPRLKPRGQVEQLSLEKAQAVAERFPDAVVIAADTVIVFHDEIIGKPNSAEEATRVLSRLSGKSHMVITAFTIHSTANKKTVTKSSVTTVTMKKLTRKEIDAYVASGEPLDKAGCYGIQGKGALFIEKIEGDYFTVVGLPLYLVAEELKRFGVTTF